MASLAAVVDGGSIWTSTNAGVTWTERNDAGSRDWASIASSSDGTSLAAVVRDGFIWTSTNAGATWTEQTAAGSRTWRSIASSSDGTVCACGPGRIREPSHTSPRLAQIFLKGQINKIIEWLSSLQAASCKKHRRIERMPSESKEI
ncbi:hypothetical protein Naga_101351g1 [Nannochloropsis gaditana]|uniref:Uncharacterized protein n=1 Tax=Nannochloropsis gaditana TaxID=72520 RepID=W7U1I7_9STRA|nr:hypothetical protein Naga_101351g1 [Nannochloropsis gaditana]